MSNQQLLDEITLWHKSYQKANELFSQQIAPDFNLFKLFKTNELVLSNCISFLLNEQESHGQKDLFLKKFITFINEKSKLNEKSTLHDKKYHVYTEYTITDYRRIDILLTDNNNYIAIENKPWANDQLDQLKDYSLWLHKKTPQDANWLLIYLCNEKWSESSLPQNTDISLTKNIIHITFHEVFNWLSDCFLYVQAPNIRLFIKNLIQYIQEEVNGELDMTEQKGVIDTIIKKPENISAALLIEKSIKKMKQTLFQKFIDYINNNIELSKNVNETKIEVILDEDINCTSSNLI